jgi:hypothetical protein
MYVPQVIDDSIGGVMKAMMKLFIQFDDALIDVPLARIERGKISAIKVHDAGPQL